MQYALDINGNRVSEAAFWTPNPLQGLERTHIGPEVVHATPYPWILAVPQRETEKAFDLDLNSRNHFVDRPAQLLNFGYTNDPEYPIHALVKNLFSHVTSVYRCKYLIGSDGAGSTTREILGIHSESNEQDGVWVVADMELKTDFPDHRRRAVVGSPSGVIMMIPNSRGGNRVYTQLSAKELVTLGSIGSTDLSKPEVRLIRAERKDATLLDILRTRLKEVLAPYTTLIKKLQWISQYQVKQRIVDEFSDRARVFVTGDACHTHSPKAAQGLNISMMDAYNLTWKLALVLNGRAKSEILDTYNKERRQIAQELLDFDRKFSHLYSKKEFLDNNSQFHDVYDKAQGFTTGLGLRYDPNPLVEHDVGVSINARSLEPLTPGKRLHTLTVTRHIDGIGVNMLDEMPSNGRFHLFIFAGNILSQDRDKSFAKYLNSADSVLSRYSLPDLPDWAFENIRETNPNNRGRIVDLFFIHTDSHYDLDLAKMPAPLPSWKYRVYADKDAKEHENHGVDPNVGAMVLVRPDGYISLITSMDGGPAITKFMDSFMNVQEPMSQGASD